MSTVLAAGEGINEGHFHTWRSVDLPCQRGARVGESEAYSHGPRTLTRSPSFPLIPASPTLHFPGKSQFPKLIREFRALQKLKIIPGWNLIKLHFLSDLQFEGKDMLRSSSSLYAQFEDHLTEQKYGKRRSLAGSFMVYSLRNILTK